METVSCNLCHSSNYRLLYNLTDLLLERKDVKSILVECLQCGLVYQNPRPTLEEMKAHYPPEYNLYNPEPYCETTPWLMKKAIQYGIRKRCRSVIRFRREGRLLDMGCATGTFLRGMHVFPNWELFGVEINREAAHIAKEKHGLNVFAGTLEEANYPERYMDVVTLWDVLEHLHDPSSSLREIHRILKPGGILIFRVPNKDSWDAKLFGPYWVGLEPPRHLYVFDKDLLTLLLEQTGFKIHKISCSSGGYPTFVQSIRFLLTPLSGTRKPNQTLKYALLATMSHPIMRLISSPFFFLYGLGLRGSLITVTAVKA